MRQELTPAIEDYERFRRSQNYSKNTIRNQNGALKAFLRVNGNIWCHQIDDRHVTRLFEELVKTRSSNSLGPVDSALRGFFDWCRQTRRMPSDRDPMFGRRPPKAVKRERQRVHRSKFGYMLDQAENISPWHRALTAVLLHTLLRDSEAASILLRDVDLDAGYIKVRIEKSSLEDRIPISRPLDRELRKWLTVYTQEVGPLQPHYFLLPARRATPIHGKNRKFEKCVITLRPEKKVAATAKQIQRVLATVGIDISEKGEGAHTLRRSGARALFDALSEAHHPRPLRVVKDMLHHEQESTSERYIGAEADRLDRDACVRGQDVYGILDGEGVVRLENVR